ncbi:transposase [Mesorhizobium sp. ORM16]|uniref:transposase n=1 Tax=Mesorhizobium sp. ORM16 TaxID=3376989 RepID=UPI003857961F
MARRVVGHPTTRDDDQDHGLQALYGLSDDQAEFQIQDRLSLMRFLGGSATGFRTPRRSGSSGSISRRQRRPRICSPGSVATA